MSTNVFFSPADSLALEVIKKLESYMSGESQLLVIFEDLTQATARLTAENRSTRESFMTWLQLLSESTSKQDEMKTSPTLTTPTTMPVSEPSNKRPADEIQVDSKKRRGALKLKESLIFF